MQISVTTTRRVRRVQAAILAGIVALALLGPAGEASAGHQPVCGETITHDVTLTASVGPCPGDGIVIGADGITLDLAGHAILGTPGPQLSGTGAGVLNEGYDQVTVTSSGSGANIAEFDGGVVLVDATENVVSNLQILADNGDSLGALTDWGEGIGLWSSDDNTIENNVVTGNGSFAGIGLYAVDFATENGSDRNTVQGNQVLAQATGPTQDIGIRVEPYSSYNLIEDNTVGGSRLDGIALFFGAVHNQVLGNEIFANGRDGLRLWWRPVPGSTPDHGAGASHTVVDDNRICGNGSHGLWVGSQDNVITGNQVGDLVSNPLSGCATHPTFDLKDENPTCDNNAWSNNAFTSRNQPCVN